MKKNTDVEAITKQLEQGVKDLFESGSYAEYLEFMARFTDYSANNCLLIYLQKPDASLVAGYKAWQSKFNRQVKKGEKGIKILAPCPHKFKKLVVDPEGNEVETEVKYMTFRAISVFDISQTEGEDVPSICRMLDGEVEGFDDLLEKLKGLAPVPVGFEEIKTGANGYFHPGEKRIAIKTGMSEVQTLKTLVHEIAHSKLHDQENGEEKDASGRTKEVQAESVAYTVLSFLGLDASEYSFGYIAGWSAGKECKELAASMEVIRRTAGEIIEGLRAA